jgi:hypothetical protein
VTSSRAFSPHVQLLLLWLRCEVLGRKWIICGALAFVLAVAWFIGVALLPHHTLNALRQYDTKTGIQEFPHGVRESP